MKNKIALGILIILGALLTACGGSSSGPVVADTARGKDLYNRSTLGTKSAEGCVSCHKYDESQGKAEKAPYTKCTGTRAATRVPGLTAEQYIRESLVNPDAYVVEGWQKGDMYQGWSKELAEQQIADLVAYLLTEKCQ